MIIEPKYDRRKFCRTLAGLLVPLGFPAIVRAANFSESLAFRGQGSAFSISTKTNNWANRVVTNGYTRPTNATLAAVDKWHLANVAAGIDSKYVWASVVAPDNVGTVITPFYITKGTDPGTFVPVHDPVPTINGVNFTGDGNKYINTGVIPSTDLATNAAGICIYNYAQGAGANSAACGSADIAFTQFFGLGTYASLTNFYCYGLGTILGSAGNPFLGWLSGQRTASNAEAFYKANSGVAHTTVASTATPTGTSAAVFFYFGQDAQNTPCQNTLSIMAITSGFTNTEDTAAFNASQQMRVDFGGGFV